jgi:hypothetical protein
LGTGAGPKGVRQKNKRGQIAIGLAFKIDCHCPAIYAGTRGGAALIDAFEIVGADAAGAKSRLELRSVCARARERERMRGRVGAIARGRMVPPCVAHSRIKTMAPRSRGFVSGISWLFLCSGKVAQAYDDSARGR